MKTRRDVFQALSDPTRRAILLLLASQPLTAGTIAGHFESARPTISKHIKVLTECDMVKPHMMGREIYYEVNPSQIDAMEEWVKIFRNNWKSRFDKLDRVLDELKKSNNEE